MRVSNFIIDLQSYSYSYIYINIYFINRNSFCSLRFYSHAPVHGGTCMKFSKELSPLDLQSWTSYSGDSKAIIDIIMITCIGCIRKDIAMGVTLTYFK